jgi:predicted acyltransferase
MFASRNELIHPPKMPNETSTGGSQRLMSLDALRGFDMFWIMGGDGLAAALGKLSSDPVTQTFATQLEHVEWAGFHFYDLIFPLFVFIVGVSIVFSLTRAIEQHGRGGALKRVFVRFALMFGVALFYSGGFASAWPDIRLLGVLNRIALCYLGAALIFCFLQHRWRAMAGIAAGLLVGYWALMSFVEFPDLRPVNASGGLISEKMTATNIVQLNWNSTATVKGVFEPGFNFAHYIDQKYLPGKKWDKTWDPEGLLSTLPAIASCLLGVLAGLLLKSQSVEDRRKITVLFAGGVVAVLAGFVWNGQFPVIKKIWSSSFVLVAGGYSAILLGLFYLVVDVLKYRRWCQVFVWYGMNPITVYLADNIIGFRRVASRFLGTNVKAFFDATVTPGFGDLMLSFGEIGIGLCLVWFLYRRKIFLRL